MNQETPESGEQISRIESSLTKEKLSKGARYFVLFTFIGFTVLFFFTSSFEETVTALKFLEPRFFMIAIGLSAVDLFLGGFRNHLFVRKIKPGTNIKLCLRANVANLFMGSVTPSQSGGGPAQIFVLYRGGVPLPSILAMSVITFLSTLVFFLIAASFAMVFVKDMFSTELVLYIVQYSFAVFSAVTLFFVIALWRPDILGRLILRITAFLSRKSQKHSERLRAFGEVVNREIGKYHITCRQFIREQPRVVFWCVIVTVVLYLNKFTLAYFLMRGLGGTGEYASILSIQAILIFIAYASPSPGGSGIAELSIGALMKNMMPLNAIAIFAVLQRFFLYYLPAILGFFVLTGELKSDSGKPEKREETKHT